MKTIKKTKTALIASLLCHSMFASSVIAAPSGGSVVSGSANISNPNNIIQNSNVVHIDWSSFNINSGETVNFSQSNPNMIAINNVTGTSVSTINGALTADAHVALFNTNGIVFGSNSSVNVGSLIASSNSFVSYSGNRFTLGSGTAKGPVINNGTITANDGSVILMGHSVANNGSILAVAGNVELAAGAAGTIDFNGDGLIRFSTTITEATETTEDGVAQSAGGRIEASVIRIKADMANAVLNNAINTDGIMLATRIDGNGGEIALTGSNGNIYIADNAVLDNRASDSSGVDGSMRIRTSNGNINQDGELSGGAVVLQAANGDINQISGSVDGSRQVYMAGTNLTLLDNSIDAPTTTNGLILQGNVTIIDPPPPIITDPPGGGTPPSGGNPPSSGETELVDTSGLVNANSIASAVNESVSGASNVSLGLYDVEGSGIRLPADQDEF